jgi:hypothetical protein
MAYGVAGLILPFNIRFWIFYVSLCTITIWIAFKFMSAEKLLKYDVITKLSSFGNIPDAVRSAINTEMQLDGAIQPEFSGSTETPPIEQLPQD